MQADFYAHYGAAPIFVWVIRENLYQQIKSLIGTGHKVFKFSGVDDQNK